MGIMVKRSLFIFLMLLAVEVNAQQVPDLDAIDAVSGTDLFYCVDASDLTDGANGTGKKCTATQIQTAIDTTYTAGDALTLTGTDIDFDGGATPGGELGGTWASPTVDATHSGSAHHSEVTFAGTGTYVSLLGQVITVDTITESDISDLQSYVTDVFSCASGDCSAITVADGDLLNFSAANNSTATEGIILPQGTAPTGGTAEGQIGWDTDNDFMLVGDGTTQKYILPGNQLYPSNASTGECAANITADAAAALSVAGCSYYSFTSNDTTSTNRTFCLQAGSEGQVITLFADVVTTSEIELGDGGAGACADTTGAATFLAGVWPAATNQNNDVATIVYRTTASGAVANGWYEIRRSAN